MFYVCSVNRYDDLPDETPEERDARQHRVVHRLTDLLMGQAEELAADTVSPRVEKAMALARIARAVRTTMALGARLAAWAIERERKRRALDADKAADIRREHIRKTKLKVVLAFRDIVERGVDQEYLNLAEQLMDGDRYDEALYELPCTEALAIVANDLGGNFDRKTFGKPRPAETTEAAPPQAAPPQAAPRVSGTGTAAQRPAQRARTAATRPTPQAGDL